MPIPKNQKWRITPSRTKHGIMPRVFDLFMPELYEKTGRPTLAGRYMSIGEAMDLVCRAELYSSRHPIPGELIGSPRVERPVPEPDLILHRV